MTRIPRGAAVLKWRRQRQQKLRQWPTLNLVALMDVFTILVLFFLVHSTDGAIDNDSGLVKLPESVSGGSAREAPVLTLAPDRVLFEGQRVFDIDAALQASAIDMETLDRVLKASRLPETSESAGRELVIMGDRSIPFDLLQRVMQTCTGAGYRDISLAVLHRSPEAR